MADAKIVLDQIKLSWGNVFNVGVAAVFLALGLKLVSGNSETITPPLTVVASVTQSPGRVDISGRVLQEGTPVGQALVWTIVDYDKNQHASPPPSQTDNNGGFSIGPLTVMPGAVVDATIYARKVIPGGFFKADHTIHGQDFVQLVGEPKVQPEQTVQWSPLIIWPMVGVFAVSFLLPFFFPVKTWKYQAGIFLAFAATFLMIFFVSTGLNTVTNLGQSKDILQLGFASIYRSTYVKDVPPEWVFSFTAPPAKRVEAPPPPSQTTTTVTPTPEPTAAKGTAAQQTQSTPSPSPTPSQTPVTKPTPTPTPTPASPAVQDAVTIDHGFGAPLWVILVSVLGAGVVTISLIVDEITKMSDLTARPNVQAGNGQPGNVQAADAQGANGQAVNGQAANAPPAVDPKLIRGHVQTLVQHQFFILFSPVTAIFVYQALVAGSAASSSIMVGFAALGAGPSLSALLTKAGALATKLFQ